MTGRARVDCSPSLLIALSQAYNSSKAAVVKLTETMAYEFAYSVKEKIRVNSVGESTLVHATLSPPC